MIRKFIVKNFALNYKVKIFGKEYSALRCTRIMAPYFIVMGFIITLDPSYPILQIWDWLLLGGWAFLCWLTFPLFGLGYFAKWPVKREELDDEQKEFYDIFQTIKNKSNQNLNI